MERIRLALIGAACAAVLLLASVGATSLVSSPVDASMQETVKLASGSTVALSTPDFIVKGKRYAFTWPGGGPPQTFTVKEMRRDGWILVEVAEENIDPNLVPFGNLPVRWLNAAIATSIQEMRPILH
jgi:hypothetical protein